MQAHTPIPTFTGRLANIEQPLVDARDLHAYLQVESRFNDWIANRIQQYGFVEGEDFYSDLSKTPKLLFGGRPRRDYHLSLEMAKELALVENNAQGRIIRRELIAFERRVRERVPQLEAALEALRQQALATNPLWRDLTRYQSMGLSQAEIGRLVQRAPSTVGWHLRRMQQAGLIKAQTRAQRLSDGKQMALPGGGA